MEDRADLAEHVVAGDMAKRVVDQLESIEIDQRGGEADRAARLFGKRLLEGTAVGRLSQRIMVGGMDRLALVRGQLEALLLEVHDLLGKR